MNALLNVKQLRAGYGAVEVLRGVDLEVMPGETVALLGSNGAGKTTVNGVLSGLVNARAGQVMFDGQDMTAWHPRKVLQAGSPPLPDARTAFPHSNAFETLALPPLPSVRRRSPANCEIIHRFLCAWVCGGW